MKNIIIENFMRKMDHESKLINNEPKQGIIVHCCMFCVKHIFIMIWVVHAFYVWCVEVLLILQYYPFDSIIHHQVTSYTCFLNNKKRKYIGSVLLIFVFFTYQKKKKDWKNIKMKNLYLPHIRKKIDKIKFKIF